MITIARASLFVATALAAAGASACSTSSAGVDIAGSGIRGDSVEIPLTDLPSGTYRGFRGGLYADGSMTLPAAHATDGLSRAAKIRPLDANGNVSAAGKIVLLSIGMSNTSQEFCEVNGTTECFPETFMGRAAAEPSLNRPALVIVNGAQGGEDAIEWISPTLPTYNVVRDRLTQLGVTEKQVQAVWLKQATANPTVSLPSSNADAYVLESRLGSVVRALRTRYPNLQQVFMGTRVYGGYATGKLNPEPYAFESGFAVKWLVQAQIDQVQAGHVVDTNAGDLSYGSAAPWIDWGPYAWANGTSPRSDGLTWIRDDFGNDGTHPSSLGRAKAGTMLLSFFTNSQFTRCWFVASGSC